LKTRTQNRPRPPAAPLLLTAVGSVVCACVFVAIGFAVVATLGRPAPLVRVAAAIPAAVARTSIVWSSEVVDGRRVRAVCRSVPVPGHAIGSFIVFSDGRMALTNAAGATDVSGAAADPQLEIETVLAGCSADVVRMVRQELEPRFAQGDPVSVRPGVRARVPVYLLTLIRGHMSIELSVDRRSLAPFSLRVHDGVHSGSSRLHEMRNLAEAGSLAATPQ
jgi:hypothetical protein